MIRTLIAAAVCCAARHRRSGCCPVGAAEAGPVPVVTAPVSGSTPQPTEQVEDFAAYVPQTSCDPRWRPGVRKFRDLVMTRYPTTKNSGLGAQLHR